MTPRRDALPPDLSGWYLNHTPDQERLSFPLGGWTTSWQPRGARETLYAEARAIALREEPAVPYQTSGILMRRAAEIRRDGGTQARCGLQEETVEDYAEAMRNGLWRWSAENAVVVFRDHAGDLWLADGFHRVEAALRTDPSADVCADIRPGERRDAVLCAAGANAHHGLRRTRQDVQRAIEVLLRDPEWQQWSDREIARRVGCSDKTVAACRVRLSAEIPQMDGRTVTRNETTYTQIVNRMVARSARSAPAESAEPDFPPSPSTYTIPPAHALRASAPPPAVRIGVIPPEPEPGQPDPPEAAADPAPAVTSPLAAVAEALRRGDTTAAYAAARLLHVGDGRALAFTTIDRVIDGTPKDAAVIAMIAAPIVAPLSAFPPGHVEAGIGAIERRLIGQLTERDDIAWARVLRPQLDAAREGMQPDVWIRWSTRLTTATAALTRLMHPAPLDDTEPPRDVIAPVRNPYATLVPEAQRQFALMPPMLLRLVALSLGYGSGPTNTDADVAREVWDHLADTLMSADTDTLSWVQEVMSDLI